MEEGRKRRQTPNLTNDVNIDLGPAASWLLLHDRLQLQALLGMSKPQGIGTVSPSGLFTASIDF